MAHLAVNDRRLELDADGYLAAPEQWSAAVAAAIAEAEGIDLTDAHWEVLHLLRDYYRRFDHAPAMRPLVKYMQQQLGKEKGTSIYLMQLFPGSPAKLSAKIAGLPRPSNCL